MDITTVSETRMLEMVFPDQTNHYGTLFGGHALRLMDMAAFVTASRYSRKAMVTASSERVDFSAPAKHGQLVELVGRVQRVGRTSVNVVVDMFAEDLLTGERHMCATGNFTLVAVDELGQPTPIQATDSGDTGQP